jgi:hypothetical protein
MYNINNYARWIYGVFMGQKVWFVVFWKFCPKDAANYLRSTNVTHHITDYNWWLQPQCCPVWWTAAVCHCELANETGCTEWVSSHLVEKRALEKQWKISVCCIIWWDYLPSNKIRGSSCQMIQKWYRNEDCWPLQIVPILFSQERRKSQTTSAMAADQGYWYSGMRHHVLFVD